MDGVLSGLGYQSFTDGVCSSATTISTTFVPSGFPTTTIHFNLAKNYLIRVNIGAFQSSTLGFIFWQALFNQVGQSTITISNTAMRTCPSFNNVSWTTFDIPVSPFTSGNWTMDLYFKCTAGTDANTNNNCAYSVTVIG